MVEHFTKCDIVTFKFQYSNGNIRYFCGLKRQKIIHKEFDIKSVFLLNLLYLHYANIITLHSFSVVATLLTAKYIRNFGRKTMYFLSAILTVVFEVAFGLVDYLDLGARFTHCNQ